MDGQTGQDSLATVVITADTFMALLDSPATQGAIATDGVNRETVQVFVSDREMAL